jgi:anti-anti-sigma factor
LSSSPDPSASPHSDHTPVDRHGDDHLVAPTYPGSQPPTVAALAPALEELDGCGAVAFAEELAGFDPRGHIIIDLSAVTFCDSAGARSVRNARVRHVAAGGSLQVTGASSIVRWVLDHCGAADVLPPWP